MEERRPWPGRGSDIQQGEGALNLIATGALVIALAIGASFKISTEPSGTAEGVRVAVRTLTAVERCKFDRRGIAFYRSRYSDHRAIRGLATPHPAGRKPRNCADAHYLADLWPPRSFQERRATERWIVKERERNRIPVGEEELRAYVDDDCLETIIEYETGGTWDPTIDYGFGHGNVYEAYGLPQANPGTKMSSAGPDWRTNPKTQIAWMIGYVNDRYGGSCSALAHWNAVGHY